jgi:hypothetical protein
MNGITPEDLRSEARRHFEIGNRLREAADALEKLGTRKKDKNEDGSSSSSSTASPNASSSSSSDNTLSRTRIEVVAEVLLDARKPLTKEEIQIGTAQKGFPIRGETLATYLSRDDRFYQVGRGRWGHAELMGKYEEEK